MNKLSLGILVAATGVASVVAQDEVKWDKSASFGVTLTQGNSETMLAAANFQADRKGSENEVSLGATATYGSNDGNVNANYLRGFGQYNRLYNDKLFGYLRVDAIHDDIADLNLRLSIGPGVGYYFIKSDVASLQVEAGASYTFEDQGGNSDSYASLRFAERYSRKITETTNFWQSAEFLPQIDDWENFLLLVEIGVESKITDNLSLRAVLQDNYDNQPAPGRKENDLRLITGISHTF